MAWKISKGIAKEIIKSYSQGNCGRKFSEMFPKKISKKFAESIESSRKFRKEFPKKLSKECSKE